MSPELRDAKPGEDVTLQHDKVPAVALSAMRLTVIEGPDEGRSFEVDPLAPQRLLLGTGPACELRLTDPTISRRHAALEPLGLRCRITDLGSTNGTSIDGVSIVEVYLRGKEVIRCGGTALRVDAEVRAAGEVTPRATAFRRLVGESEAMRRLYPMLERVAATRASVLIEGEPGTGKELLAESLHEASGATGLFIVFDCSATPSRLAQTELFGTAEGADAYGGFAGALERAHRGTLFIDELGDLDKPLQAELLRVLERGEVVRVGGQEPIRVQVRLIAATRRDLDAEVAEGRFHEGLLRRVALARIELPPLRARLGDVALLAAHFAAQIGAPNALSAEVLSRLERSTWPGNVRELYAAVVQRVALGDEPPAERAPAADAARKPPDLHPDYSAWIDRIIKDQVPFPIARRRAIEAFDKGYIERILEAHGGSVAKAIAASGIARRYFQLVKARSSGG